MTSETKPLYIYGEPDMAKIRDAKQKLGVPFLVVPHTYDQDTPLTARVLAYEKVPPRLCDYALIGPRTPLDGIVAALEWVLLGTDDPRATTIVGTLTDIFGFGVKEVDPSDSMEYDKAQNLKKASVRFRLGEPGDSRDR